MYKCYDGQLLLPFDHTPVFVERDKVSMTEQTYISRDKQIASFIRSGERLQAFRREDFDYPDGIVPDDAKPNPMDALGFDLSDAFLLSKELQAKIAAAKARAAVEEKGVPGENPVSPGTLADESKE